MLDCAFSDSFSVRALPAAESAQGTGCAGVRYHMSHILALRGL